MKNLFLFSILISFLIPSALFAGKYSYEGSDKTTGSSQSSAGDKDFEDFEDFDTPKKKKKKRKKSKRKPASVKVKTDCLIYKKLMNGKKTTVVELVKKKSRKPSSASKCLVYKKKKGKRSSTIIEIPDKYL